MSAGPLLLGIDEGTTAVKAALFDLELDVVAEARRPVGVAHPEPGWVEQDPELILEAVVDAVAAVLERRDGREVLAAGLDHQGESVLAWDARDGRALTQVIVWQDKRQETLLERVGAGSVRRSGLPLDPYFSAGKLAWLLEHDAAVAQAREAGALRLGTVDAFLADRLAGRFATDLSTASRTQLLAVGGRDWDRELLGAFGLRREWLPRIGPTFGALGELAHERWPVRIPLTAQLVDQQAALAGSGAVRAGELKATYGTGVFVLGLTERPLAPGAQEAPRVGAVAEPAGPEDASERPSGGLLPTVAWAAPDQAGGVGEVSHALDGGVFAAGALLDWLAQGLGLAASAEQLAGLAADVPDAAGVRVLPALAGLGAPWWEPHARGVIAGLHGGVRPAQVARAALESIAWRVADIVEAAAELAPVSALRVDGGLTNDATLLQLQADALGMPVTVGAADGTVRGAALLAGVGAGVFGDLPDGARRIAPGRTVEPLLDARTRSQQRERWRAFVRAAALL